MSGFDKNIIMERMQKALDVLHTELNGLRSGRANVSMVEPLLIDAYGGKMPLSQLASVSTPESRMISISVWDASLVKSVESAIQEGDLGLNPQTEGSVIRVNVPELNEERRIELTKVAGKYAEQARISVRNIRRDENDKLKKQEKDNDISKDESHQYQELVQKATDETIAKIDTLLKTKETEIMQV